MVLWMVLTLAHPLVPMSLNELLNPTWVDAAHSHQAMMQLFVPSLRILAASLFAYLCSQWLDIILFNKIREITSGRFLWLRQTSSMLISGFLDTVIFSVLAWQLLSFNSMSWFELFMTFILSSQIIRVFLNFAATPFMYLSYLCLPGSSINGSRLSNSSFTDSSMSVSRLDPRSNSRLTV